MKLDDQIKFIRGKIKELEMKRGLIYEALSFKEDESDKLDELAKVTDEINNFDEVVGTLEKMLIWAVSKL